MKNNTRMTSIRVLLHKLAYVMKRQIRHILDYICCKERVYDIRSYSLSKSNIFFMGDECGDDEHLAILNRSFFWLGMDGKTVPAGVWNRDYLSGYTWGNDYYQNIVLVDLGNDADIKVPWELSRLQHLSVLAIYYCRTHDDSIVVYIASEIIDWINKNPYKHGVNWTCAMEVAIRAINLIFIALLLSEELFRDEEFFVLYISTLMNHGQYISQNLETYDEYYNNHYLSDLLGLQWVGSFCEEYLEGRDKRNAQKMEEFARKEIVKECYKQIYNDGTDYESSVAYHRFVTELLYLSVFIDRVYKKEPIIEVIEVIPKMTKFLSDIRMPDGSLPMIGDSDDGRIIILNDYSSWNKEKADYIFCNKTKYLSGILNQPDDPIPAISYESSSYDDSGYYILRNKNIYCLTHCGPLSLHGHGGHSHNDQLSIICCVFGLPFVVDSGTFSYSRWPGQRNYFRSTGAHSTLEILGYEQNELIEDNLFMMREKTFSQCLYFDETSFVGEHYGYSEVGIIHRRGISVHEDRILIEDTIVEEQRKKDIKWVVNYILDTDVVIDQLSKRIILLKKNKVSIKLISNVPMQYFDAIVSKEYGKKEKTIKIRTLPSNEKSIKTEFVFGG